MAASTDPQIQTQNSVNFADPYYLSNGDHPGMQLGNHILTGSNFLNWSRTVRMALIARNKLQFVDGTLPSPSPDYQKWIRNDYMVMSWLLNSVDKSLAESFMFVNSSADLWKEISERFGQSNAPQVFELHISLSSSNQNNDSIAEYYGRLKSVWDQLQILEGFPDCTCEALKLCSCGVLKKILEMDQRRKLMQLLAGLNRNYDQVKTNLLSLDPLPSINKAYHTLQQIEQQNKLNLLATNSVETNSMNAAANAVMTPKVFPKPSYMQNPDYKKIKSDLLCTHCKKRGHGVDSCFKLYGVPTWYTELKRKAPANVRLAGNASGSAGILGKAPVQGDEHGSSISSADPTAMTHMYNELLRMIQNKSPSSLDNPLSSAINFAGTTIAFHVDNLKHVFDKTAWIIDTGASDHMVGNLDLFASIHKLKNPIKVSLPDGTFTFVLYAGSVALTVDLLIHNVFYIPSFKHNLLSVGRLLDHHSLVAHFEKDSCLFQDLVSKQVKAVRTRFSGLYKFSSTSSDFHSSVNNIQHVDVSMLANNLITKSVLPSIDVVHARLGHPSASHMKHVTIPISGNKTCDFSCEACVLGKHHKFPFSISLSMASQPFDLIHVDLWGKYKRPSLSGAFYFLTVVDDNTRVTWTFLIHDKTQVFSVITGFFSYVHTQFGKSVKMLRSDNGTEIIQEVCAKFFIEQGIIHQKSIPGNPQQNGRVERKHRHLLETARTLRLHASLPYKFWGECLLAATYLINLLPSSVLHWKSPFGCYLGSHLITLI
ncbi:uncharacterized protein LOC110705276 [Chenopodium quinoa]|uniref:uncharacterized protein LOC110705276 n=1 Tax=Chenopodium quinoa TaxID=63459 RepID=UPI000B785491|nr:uncharacterized protein LOC110705276 [Chenopodium quinoa]